MTHQTWAGCRAAGRGKLEAMSRPPTDHPRIDIARSALATVFALLLLNALLSLRNWWPTPGVLPDARLGPEFVVAWVLLLWWTAWRGPMGGRALTVVTAAFVLLTLGRYANVTVPTLFGRPVNLYWDGQQIPRFVWVTMRESPGWQVALVGAGLLLAAWAGWRVLRWAVGQAAGVAAPYALRAQWTWLPTGAAMGLLGLQAAGAAPALVWHTMADPVTPTYARQARLLAGAWWPGRLERLVPASPALESALDRPGSEALGGLKGRDVDLLFLESYGAIAFEHPAIAPGLVPARGRLAEQVARAGYGVVSAYVRAATFAGASELSHLSLLSGIDLSDPLRHDLLMTSDRPLLTTLFHRAGYETVGLYPALSWDWAEGRFYAFDRFLDARDLGYPGPPLGYWKVPDQYSRARVEQLVPRGPGDPPRLLFFPTITSHLPFGPVPPYQPDWPRMLSADPFGAEATERLKHAYVDWLDMRPNYVGSIAYTYDWLGGHLLRQARPDTEQVWVGDHQPAASVSGEGADWAVPVHVLSRDPALLQRLVDQGFQPGLAPQRPVLGGLDALTAMLLRAWSLPAGDEPVPAGEAISARTAFPASPVTAPATAP